MDHWEVEGRYKNRGVGVRRKTFSLPDTASSTSQALGDVG